MDCPKYITQWLFASEKKEDDGRYVDQVEEEEDNIDDRLRMIAKMKEEERWCDGCGSTRIVVMKKHTDARYMKYCNDCPFVSPAKEVDLPTGLLKQREVDEKRARKKRLKARKEEAKRRLEAEKEKAAGEADRTEEVPLDYKRSEKTRMMTDQEFCDALDKALKRGDIKWE